MDTEQRFAALRAQPLTRVGATSTFVGGTWSSIIDVLKHRELLGMLVRRDLKSRYKDSNLGFLWTLVRPLTQLVIYYVVMGQVLGAARSIDDFAIYIFAGFTVYTLFSEIVAGSTASIVANSGLIKKIYVPREIFPLATVGASLFNFVIQLGILIAATLVLMRFPTDIDLLYALPSLAIILIYAVALGLLLAAVNVYLRDIQFLVEVLLMLMMWGSPIVYAWTMVRDVIGPGILLDIYTNNPLTLAVLGFQKAFWIAGDDSMFPAHLPLRMAIAGLVGILLLWICQRVFSRLQGNFAQQL